MSERKEDHPEWVPFSGTLSKLIMQVNLHFSSVGKTTREDILQESLLTALRRGRINKPLTRLSARMLSIDAFRTIYGRAANSFTQHVPIDPSRLLNLADAPNQLTDLEAKDAMLTEEELAFETELGKEESGNVAREIQTRIATGSAPFNLEDFIRYVSSYA
jgi:hypothetical protein